MRKEKSFVVLDTSVVVSAIFWKGDAHRCLLALSRREFFAVINERILAEYEKSSLRIHREEKPEIDPRPVLVWLRRLAKDVDPVKLRGRLSRDASDDLFVATALAAEAKYVVTHDPDLLVLEKPFGIEMIRPREFLRKITAKHS